MEKTGGLTVAHNLGYTVAEVRNLFDPRFTRIEKCAWAPGITMRDVALACSMPGPVVITRNGSDQEESPLSCVDPGDFLTIWPEIHPPLAPIIPAIAGMAIGSSIGGMLGLVVGTVVSLVGGIIVSSLLSNTPDANAATPDKSPTYGFDGANPSREGYPGPVYYGETIVTPLKIGEYMSTDEESNQTYHGLYIVGQGEADGEIPAEDVLIKDEPLRSYKNYSINSSIGSNFPAVDSFPNFTKVHQYRSFSRPLEASEVTLATLIHFNGEDGSTVIIDETGEHAWTVNGGAALSIADPFKGTACLDCPGGGDHICTASPVYGWDQSATIEFRAKVADLADRGFIGGEYRDGADLVGWWGLVYKSGRIYFNLVVRIYDYETGLYSYTSICSLDAAATLGPGVWHHIAIQKNSSRVAIYLDGVKLAFAELGDGWSAFKSAAPHTTVGMGRLLEDGASVIYDGLCGLDELRIATGKIIYEWDGYAPPSVELSVLEFETAETLETLNAVDSCKVVLAAPRGLYRQGDQGERISYTVKFELAYRRIGAAPWTVSEITLKDATYQAVRREYELIFPARARHEIRIERTTPADDSSYTQNETSWIAIDEMLHEHLLYPNYQVLELNIKADERLQGSIPEVKVIGRRSALTVPTYDGMSTQTVDAANPAWVAYDILTSDLYGAAVNPAVRIDPISHQDFEEWDDGLVAGKKRARFNGAFDTEMNVQQALRYVYDVGRASGIALGQKIAWAVEKPGQAKHQFHSANTDPSSHVLTFIPTAERVDVIVMEFLNKDKRWKRSSVTVPSSTFNTLSAPARSTKIFLRGCNNEGSSG